MSRQMLDLSFHTIEKYHYKKALSADLFFFSSKTSNPSLLRMSRWKKPSQKQGHTRGRIATYRIPRRKGRPRQHTDCPHTGWKKDARGAEPGVGSIQAADRPFPSWASFPHGEQGHVLAWASLYCGILTRLSAYLDLRMPKLPLVHWSRQNLTVTHNPGVLFYFVFKGIIFSFSSVVARMLEWACDFVFMCLCLHVIREKEQTTGINQTTLLTDIHSGGMKSYSLALARLVWINLTGSMISYYHRKIDHD